METERKSDLAIKFGFALFVVVLLWWGMSVHHKYNAPRIIAAKIAACEKLQKDVAAAYRAKTGKKLPPKTPIQICN